MASTAQHSLLVNFDQGQPRITLVHPPSGCTPGVCECGRAPGDDETPKCAVCPDERDECWVTGWVDNIGSELLEGGPVEFPVSADASGIDEVVLHVAPGPTEAQIVRGMTALAASKADPTGWLLARGFSGEFLDDGERRELVEHILTAALMPATNELES